jgi:cellobiose phosphorylase
MGSGDWNDGMNTVGNRGKGESIWLGWFLYAVLKAFAPICKKMNDLDDYEYFNGIANKLADNINNNGWDGNWYRRAYFDDGTPLGTIENTECKIDSLSQSWSVISGAGTSEKSSLAMISLENYLIDRNEGIIKLLTPPFDNSNLEPGYIKGYVPGVRENGGQYTHAAAWVIIAFCIMGNGDKAFELFDLLNPINHSRTNIEYSRYKVEPYVTPADVYSMPPHTGRGGWTWYTGSASWMYISATQYILGLKKSGDNLTLSPCIPKKWSGYSINYKYKTSLYEIKVKNNKNSSSGVKRVVMDRKPLKDRNIPLSDDGKKHYVEVFMG